MQVTQQYVRNAEMPAIPASGFEGNAPTQAGGRPIPFFFRQAVYLKEQSEAAGRPIYKTVEMVKIVIPGDNSSAPVVRVTQVYKDRFPDHYAAFQREEQIAENGTPIDSWGILTHERRYALKHLNIFTVEQIAGLSDEQLQKIGLGAHTLRDQARAFIETAKTGAVPERLVTENETLKTQVGLLTEKIGLLTRQFEMLAAQNKTDVSRMGDPVAEAQAAIRATVTTDHGTTVQVPDNYRSLGLKELREIADQISAAPVMNKADAIKIIEEYEARRSTIKTGA